MNNITKLLLIVFALSSCATNNKYNKNSISPIKAIELSAQQAPESINGIFELTVKSGEYHQRLEFLNSEVDNKDQRNLIIALRPKAVQELVNLYGVKPSDYFIGKKIRVAGVAKRIKHYNAYKGKVLRDYYYQTKIFVKSANQVTIL